MQALAQAARRATEAKREADLVLAVGEVLRIVESDLPKVQPRPEGNVNAFAEWFATKVDCKLVKFADAPHGGHGVFATRNIHKGELVLSVPMELVLSTLDAEMDALVKRWAEKSPLVRMNENVQLSLLLLHEVGLATESRFANYCSVLPGNVDLPSTSWPLADLMQLQGMTALLLAMNRLGNIASLYCHLVDTGVLNSTYQEFSWAMSIVMSRNNPVYHSSVAGPRLALVPGFDMFNHDPTASSLTTEQNPTTFAYEVRAHRDFAAGEQVTIYYGPRPDSELLVYCGFVALPPGINENTAVVLEYPLGSSDESLAKIKQVLAKDVAGLRFIAPQQFLTITVHSRDLRSLHVAAMIACVTNRDEAATALRRKLAGNLVLTPSELAHAKASLEEWVTKQQALLSSVPKSSRHEQLAAELRLSEVCAVQRVLQALLATPRA